jgi:hypothetical protein
MKENKGYMQPMRAIYAGVLTLALAVSGCGSDEPYDYDSSSTRQAYENVKKNMELNGRLKHSGKWSAILLKAAQQNGKIEDPLTMSDLAWLIELERNRDDKTYDWQE